jgi:hypothetical protein
MVFARSCLASVMVCLFCVSIADRAFADPQACGQVADVDLVTMLDKTASTDNAELLIQKNATKALLGFFSSAIVKPRVAIGSFNVTSGPDARIESVPGFVANLTDDYGTDGNPGTRLFRVINAVSGLGGYTDISAALTVAQAEITAHAVSGKPHYIVLISDGLTNSPGCPGICPCPAAITAVNNAVAAIEATGTQIFAVHYGDDTGCSGQLQWAKDFLRDQIASSPTMYFEAGAGGIDLSAIFTQIAGYLGCDDHDTCTTDRCNTDTNLCEYEAIDTDGDGTPDCHDGCPEDPAKTEPGQCGCGVPDTDSDGDGTANCHDGCPEDPLKVAPGACGCGVSDVDSDGDGTPNCHDECPNDPSKLTPGQCGCGVADTDTDGDGTPDCHDACPDDPHKIAVGQCGCGVADTDTDGDGTPDCHDACPDDPHKIAVGQCGCGVADTDTDGDGTPDCHDQCPSDPLKTSAGQCGCGTLDTDSDGDGSADCNDGCPNDPSKVSPGVCGCGVSDADSDGDGVPNCNDQCPADSQKTQPGVCGCGASDVDANGNGIADCIDAQCQSVDVTVDRGVLNLGPEQLATYARNTYAKLIRNARKVDKGLEQRLIKSSKRVDPKMKILIKRATQSLDQLPDVMLVCPDSPVCAAVDNTARIIEYRAAVYELAGVIIRTLNRATRLVAPSFAVAQARTKGFGKAVRKIRDDLRAKADQLPKTQSFCK